MAKAKENNESFRGRYPKKHCLNLREVSLKGDAELEAIVLGEENLEKTAVV